MRFTIENHPIGTIRYRKRFAFRPRLFGLKRIWLERYFEKQEWNTTLLRKGRSFESGPCKWQHLKYLLPEDIELSPLTRAIE